MSIKQIKKDIKICEENGKQDSIYKTGTVELVWCCDCNLRHINIYEVIRGKTPEEDKVKIKTIRDDMGTDLRRFFNRQIVNKKKKGRKKR